MIYHRPFFIVSFESIYKYIYTIWDGVSRVTEWVVPQQPNVRKIYRNEQQWMYPVHLASRKTSSYIHIIYNFIDRDFICLWVESNIIITKHTGLMISFVQEIHTFIKHWYSVCSSHIYVTYIYTHTHIHHLHRKRPELKHHLER